MKVLVIDDDKLVAISLKTILESTSDIEVVGLGYNGKEAITLYDEYLPDVLLMDIRMEVMSGLDAAVQILSAHEDARILFLTTFSDDEYIVKALNMGAKGYILKQDFEGIVPALTAVLGGQSVFGGEIIGKIPTLMQNKAEFAYTDYDINEKEQEIIKLVADGLSNKEISGKLFLGEGTIRNYISTILEKLQLRDRTQLAVFYYQKIQP